MALADLVPNLFPARVAAASKAKPVPVSHAELCKKAAKVREKYTAAQAAFDAADEAHQAAKREAVEMVEAAVKRYTAAYEVRGTALAALEQANAAALAAVPPVLDEAVAYFQGLRRHLSQHAHAYGDPQMVLHHARNQERFWAAQPAGCTFWDGAFRRDLPVFQGRAKEVQAVLPTIQAIDAAIARVTAARLDADATAITKAALESISTTCPLCHNSLIPSADADSAWGDEGALREVAGAA